MNAMAPAWTLTATAPTQVQLPVYYSWQFRTGEGGDFASLARRLKINVPAGLGQRTVAIGQPGFTVPGLDPKTTVKVEGALMPLKGSTPPVVWSDPAAANFELALKDIVNRPGLNQVTSPSADPLLAPPIYGRWYAGRATVTPGAANWLDSLNLDPRWRSAAALGTEVIQRAPGSVDGVGVGAGRRDSAGQPAPAAAPDEHGGGREPARTASLPAQRRHDAALRLAGLRPAPDADSRARSGRTHGDGDHGGNVAAHPGHAHRHAAHRQAARAVVAAHRREGGRPVGRRNLGGVPEPGHRSSGSGAAHDRAGASPATADGGRGRRRDLEPELRDRR